MSERGTRLRRPAALLARRGIDDPDARRVASTIQSVGIALAIGATIWFTAAPFFLPHPAVPMGVAAAMTALLLLAVLLARRGRARLAAILLVGDVWAGSVAAAALAGGISGPATIALPIAILGAGLLLGRRTAIAVALASVAAVALLAWLEVRQALPHVLPQTPWTLWCIDLSVFLATAALLWDALGRLDAARVRAAESESHARSLFEEAGDPIVLVGSEGVFLDANQRACELTGYAREELRAMRVHDLVVQLPEEEIARDLRMLRISGSVMRELVIRRRDRARRHLEINARLLPDDTVEVIARDVTARRRAETMQTRLRAALDQASEGFVVLDTRGRVLYANRIFEEMAGRAVEAGRSTAEDLSDDAQRRAIMEEAQVAIRRGRPYARRYEREVEGRRQIREVSVSPVRDASGRLAGSVAVYHDVTREVELESHLRESQKLEAVGRLAGGVAHDFNNLLTAILGLTELLHARLEGDPEGLEELESLREAAHQAADLTGQLLAVGRRQLAHPRVLDLNELVRETMPFLRRLIREDVGLEDALSAGALPVEVDPAQLRQVLLNLATNARDAMPEGGRLTIRTGRRDLAPEAPADEALPGRSVAVLAISDTGHGMDPQTRERIFEPFFTTKPVGRGTGLGLASVHGMVEQAGGRIEVESQPGKGTTFHVLLPCARRPLAPEAPAPVAPQVRSRPATVLVVEDQPMVRAVAARALRAAGYEVLEAEDGSEGLACAAGRESLDLLLTDVVLPRVGGPELAAQLRKRWPQLRILFISGYAPEELRGWPKADPRPDFLPKPFTPEELVAAVARCLEA